MSRYNLGHYDGMGHAHIIYGGRDLSSVFEILSIEAPAHPGIEAITASVPGVPGSHFYGIQVGDREVTMRLSLHAHSKDPLEVMQEWLDYAPLVWREEPQKLYLDSERYLNAIVTGEFPLEFIADRGVIEVTFTCHDPYFHGREHSVPLEPGDNEFRVVSRAKTFPTIFVAEASGSVVVTRKSTGEKVVVPGVSSAIIDMQQMKAFDDDMRFIPVDMAQSDFFFLDPGEVETITLQSGEGTLIYEERSL